MKSELLHYSDKGGHHERSLFHKTMRKLEVKQGFQPTKGEMVVFSHTTEPKKKLATVNTILTSDEE